MTTITQDSKNSGSLTQDSRTAAVTITQDSKTASEVSVGTLNMALLLPLFLQPEGNVNTFTYDTRH